MKVKLILLYITAVFLLGCGPNVLKAKGTVMNPLVKDTNEMAFFRIVTIVRKEQNISAGHMIVGSNAKPMALSRLREPAEIPTQRTNGNGLLMTVEIYSPHKDELVKPKDYKFYLTLPDGRKIKGRLHRVWKLVDFTEKVTGGAMRRHLVVRDKRSGTTTSYSHWEEVENDYTLFWRKFRVVFLADDLITMDTKYIVFEVTGHQRTRQYTFKFETDPMKILTDEEKEYFKTQ